MELSSTRTTSSVTGGSTLTALKPRVSTASMINTLLREMLLLVLLVMPRLTTLLLPSTLVLKVLVLELDVRDLQDEEEEDRDSKHLGHHLNITPANLFISRLCISSQCNVILQCHYFSSLISYVCFMLSCRQYYLCYLSVQFP